MCAGAYMSGMLNAAAIIETVEKARAGALAGREQVVVIDAWMAVRRLLTADDRRPVVFRPRRPHRDIARRSEVSPRYR